MPTAAALGSVNRGTFIAIGAMGLSLGAAWAYQRSHRYRDSGCDSVNCGSMKAKAHKRSRNKRQKSAKAEPLAEAVQAKSFEEVSATAELHDMHTHDAETATTAVCNTAEPSFTPCEGSTNAEPLAKEAEATVEGDPVHAMHPATAAAPVDGDSQTGSSCSATIGDANTSGDWISVACKQRRRRPQPAAPESDNQVEPEQVGTMAYKGGEAVKSASVPKPIEVALNETEILNEMIEESEVCSSAQPSPAEGAAGAPVDSSTKPHKPKRAKKKKRPKEEVESITPDDEALPSLPWVTRASKSVEREVDAETTAMVGTAADTSVEVATQAHGSCPMDIEIGGSDGCNSSGDAHQTAIAADEWEFPPAEARLPQEWVEVKKRRGKRPAAGKPRTSE